MSIYTHLMIGNYCLLFRLLYSIKNPDLIGRDFHILFDNQSVRFSHLESREDV